MSNDAQANADSKGQMNWESLDPEEVRVKFKSERETFSPLGDELDTLAREGTNYDQTKTLLEKVRDQIMSPSGWISTFYNENVNFFPQAKAGAKDPTARPDWYFTLSPEKRKNYDKLSDYMVDAAILQPRMHQMSTILTQLQLADTFRNLLIVRNLEGQQILFDDAAYQRINDDLLAFYDQMRMSYDALESQASQSRDYYAANRATLDDAAMKEDYLQKRKSDYSEVIKKTKFYERLYYQGNGLYSLKQEYAAKMYVLDKYSKKLVELKEKDFEKNLETVLTSCRALTEVMEKNTRYYTWSGDYVNDGLRSLLISVTFYVHVSEEHFKKFREAPKEAPYCLMRKLDALNSAPSNFGYSPKKDDPWNGGTAIEEAYKQACVAITLQCREFVNKKGKITK